MCYSMETQAKNECNIFVVFVYVCNRFDRREDREEDALNWRTNNKLKQSKSDGGSNVNSNEKWDHDGFQQNHSNVGGGHGGGGGGPRMRNHNQR